MKIIIIICSDSHDDNFHFEFSASPSARTNPVSTALSGWHSDGPDGHHTIENLNYKLMKAKNAILFIVILTTGQSCTIYSLNPLYTDEDLLDATELMGIWQEEDEGKEYVSFEEYEDRKFIFRYMEQQDSPDDLDTISFEAGLLKVGDHFFIDLYPYYDEDLEEEDYLFRGFIPTHSFLKIDWEKDDLELYIFSYDRLQELFEQNRIRIRHQMFDDYIVITASTDELQKFVQKYADDEKAFDDPGKFVKIR